MKRNAEQIFQHALRDVADVGHALLEIAVVESDEKFDVAPRRGVEAVLGVQPCGGHRFERFADDGGIVQHEQMRVENVRLRRGAAGAHVFGERSDLLPGFLQGFFKAADFLFPVRFSDFVARHLFNAALQKNERFSVHDAGRAADALKTEFLLLKIFAH